VSLVFGLARGWMGWDGWMEDGLAEWEEAVDVFWEPRLTNATG
jgi:hypothetical protein